MASVRSIAVAAAGVAGAIGLWIASAPEPAPPAELSSEATALVGELDSQLREIGAGLHSRAATLADLPALRRLVVTDAATALDQRPDELTFKLQPGETFELAQIEGGKANSLLRLPAATQPSQLVLQPGRHLVVADGGVVIAEVAEVMPTQDEARLRGALLVSHRVDLAPMARRLDELGVPSVLVVGDTTVPLATRAPSADARVVELPVPAAPQATKVVAQVSAATEPGRSMPLLIAAALVLALGLAAAAPMWKQKPAPAVAPTGPHEPLALAATTLAAAVPTPPMAPRASTGHPVVPTGPTGSMGAVGAVAAPGGQLGRYGLVRLLGSGGMADVYLARAMGEAGFEKAVALKVLHANLARRSDAVAYFLDEARLASHLIHPNVVQILDLGKAGDDYFIAMELIDGTDLEKVLVHTRAAGRQVPVPIALAILRKMCDGLHAAHTAVAADGQPLALVHRDVKSGNVLLSRNGVVKIGDFGIVKANQQLHVTAVGQASGTPATMAPEQRTGGPIDRRADVYSTGAVAYELLAGVEVNLDLVLLLPRGVEGWPHLPPPSQLRADLPPELDAIVLRALSFDPTHRYPSCEVFEQEIDRVAVSRGLVASDKDIARWLAGELAQIPGMSVGRAGTSGGAVA